MYVCVCVTLRLQLSQVLLCILGDTRCIADSIAAQKDRNAHSYLHGW